MVCVYVLEALRKDPTPILKETNKENRGGGAASRTPNIGGSVVPPPSASPEINIENTFILFSRCGYEWVVRKKTDNC